MPSPAWGFKSPLEHSRRSSLTARSVSAFSASDAVAQRRAGVDGETSSGSSAAPKRARSASFAIARSRPRRARRARTTSGSSPRIGPPANASRFCATRSAGVPWPREVKCVAVRAQPRVELPLGELAQRVVDVRILAASRCSSARSDFATACDRRARRAARRGCRRRGAGSAAPSARGRRRRASRRATATRRRPARARPSARPRTPALLPQERPVVAEGAEEAHARRSVSLQDGERAAGRRRSPAPTGRRARGPRLSCSSRSLSRTLCSTSSIRRCRSIHTGPDAAVVRRRAALLLHRVRHAVHLERRVLGRRDHVVNADLVGAARERVAAVRAARARARSRRAAA